MLNAHFLISPVGIAAGRSPPGFLLEGFPGEYALRSIALGKHRGVDDARHPLTVSVVEALYQVMPLMDLLFRAHQVHRENFDPNEVQRSALLSIKTGGCPEDCSCYCSQSARYKTDTNARH